MDIITELAKKNGLGAERYSDLVKKAVKELYHSFADEIAILRKEILILRNEISLLKGEELPETEFIHYNYNVEAIKKQIEENTGLKHGGV